MKKTIFPLIIFAFIVTLFIGFDNSDEIDNSINDVKEKNVTFANASSKAGSENLMEVIDAYALSSGSKRIKIVGSEECSKFEKNIELYYQDIYTYGYTASDTLSGYINDDNIKDYIAWYYCENCWNGIGAGNYLSNFIFVTSEKGGYKVNEELTMDFKTRIAGVITNELNSEYYPAAQIEKVINGITFSQIKNGIIYGDFIINTEVCESAQPCLKGTFDYNTKKKELKFNLTEHIK